MQANFPKIICIMGPTASGKSALAQSLALELNAEIINVDSALVYRGMDIGTAKPSRAEQLVVRHHLLDICDVSEPFDCGRFCQIVPNLIEEIRGRGRIPLLVGGTMLYFRAFLYGLSELPPADPLIRQKLAREAKALGWPAIHESLQAIDPAAHQRLHPHDGQRIARALEVYMATGKTLSEWWQKSKVKSANYRSLNIMVSPKQRSMLHERIAVRFDRMLELGFIDEVKSLFERGDLRVDLPALRAVGYRQVWAYLNGECDLSTMREQAIAATRQLAKRQYTWLRDWPELNKVSAEDPVALEALRQVIRQFLGM